MGNEEDSIADIVFQRTRSQQLVAEIAFASAIAFTASITSPTGTQGAVLYWALLGLIGIAILRYLVFTDRVDGFDRLLDLTVRPVELFAILGVAQVFKFLGTKIFQPFIDLPILEVTVVVTIIVVTAYILIFELIFEKYRFSWGTLFYVRRVALEQQTSINLDDFEEIMDAIFQYDSNSARLKAAFGLLRHAILRVTIGQAAFHLLKDSIPDRDDEEILELKEYVEMNRGDDGFNQSKGLWFSFAISAIVTIPMFVAIAWVVSLLLATFTTIILALVVMRVTKHMVALTYIAFGTMDYRQFGTTNSRWVAMMTVYTVSVYFVVFS